MKEVIRKERKTLQSLYRHYCNLPFVGEPTPDNDWILKDSSPPSTLGKPIR